MNKAIGGDGWAFRPADGDKPAMWAGNDSIVNIRFNAVGGEAMKKIGIGGAIFCLLPAVFFPPFLLLALPAAGLFAAMYFIANNRGGQWINEKWILEAFHDEKSGVLLSHDKAGSLNWAVYLDDVARVESGATAEWQKVRTVSGQTVPIPDAEMQVFIYTHDQRRLVVHTANAAREDCGQLAYSIRSYVDAQRGNAASSPASDTSSPAADGFDL